MFVGQAGVDRGVPAYPNIAITRKQPIIKQAPNSSKREVAAALLAGRWALRAASGKERRVFCWEVLAKNMASCSWMVSQQVSKKLYHGQAWFVESSVSLRRVFSGPRPSSKSSGSQACSSRRMLGPAGHRRHRMIRPTDNLRSDHVLVTRGLAVLSALGAEVRHSSTFPAADCALVLRFLREFVVGVHLYKESAAVLSRLAMHGDESTARVVGDVLRIHDEIAELSHSLVMFWEPTAELTAEERSGFVETVDAVVSRCRRLDRVEESVLFPAFDAAVPPDDQLDCHRECAAIEAERSSGRVWALRLSPLMARWHA